MLVSVKHLKEQYLPDLSEGFIYKLARDGEIPAIRVGDRWLFDPAAVLASLKDRSTVAKAGASR